MATMRIAKPAIGHRAEDR